jgi:hypothetical protein
MPSPESPAKRMTTWSMETGAAVSVNVALPWLRGGGRRCHRPHR